MDVKYGTDTKVADSTKAFRLQKEEFDREINTAVSTLAAPALANSADTCGKIRVLGVGALLVCSVEGWCALCQ